MEAFFDVHEECGSIPGGLHLEMTGDNVTECIGGGSGVTGGLRSRRLHTVLSPALSPAHSHGPRAVAKPAHKVCMGHNGRL